LLLLQQRQQLSQIAEQMTIFLSKIPFKNTMKKAGLAGFFLWKEMSI
jgi:hypothetical protein